MKHLFTSEEMRPSAKTIFFIKQLAYTYRAFNKNESCKAYISVLGDEQDQADTLEGLTSAMGYIRRELAHRINLRNTPEIRFIMDQSIEYGVTRSAKINELTANEQAFNEGETNE